FKVIHPDLSADNTIPQFLKILGVEELTAEAVQNILKTEEIPKMRKNWETFSVDEKIENIKLCKKLWLLENYQIDSRGLSFLTLKTKSGKWLKPEQIVFSKEYNPEHQIEVLAGKGLLKGLPDSPIEFVTAEFIENDEEVKGWYEFFKELGVDKKLEDKNFIKNVVQRIGILTALKYEASKGRTSSRELSRSEETDGYDIKQSQEESEEEGYGLIQSEERYIEVKSSSRPNPDIFLTTKQFNTLRNKKERYFVYVVKDALQHPTLCVTRGDKLLSITDIKTVIPFNKWSSKAIDEEFQP
ncbi:MAG TPA: hypothetical protein DEP99_04770, partial [Nitrospiraceae bacterium]|nr:hypothetical protein [Nitrospiraceae bacterium]